METEYANILNVLSLLRAKGPSINVFGSEVHQFKVFTCLAEGEVQAFEKKYGVTLPAEYRGFLTHVGNGGAGPYYGLFKLGEMDDGHDYAPWTEDNGFVGVLSKPFPLTDAWNDESGCPERDEKSESFDETEYEASYEKWEKEYFNSERVCGAIPICHLGCALRQWLVISGPEVGNIWCDDRADHGGLYPLKHEKLNRVGFLEWYQFWLNGALQQLS